MLLSILFVVLSGVVFGQTTVVYDFAAGGAMTADNLDANISFTTAINSASTAPAIFSGQLRLYPGGAGFQLHTVQTEQIVAQ